VPADPQHVVARDEPEATAAARAIGRPIRSDTSLVGKGPQARDSQGGDTWLAAFQDERRDGVVGSPSRQRPRQRAAGLGSGREVEVADEREVAVARHGGETAKALVERLHDPARVLALSDGVFAITVLRSSRKRNQHFADFTWDVSPENS
jgi:hypothetical protein